MKDFEEMFTQHFSRVYRFALRLTRDEHQAEEITQQTFFKALKKIDTFEGRSDPATWLCSIAKNEYLNGLRRREDAYPPDSRTFDAPTGDASQEVEREDRRMRIHVKLHELAEPYREVFMLRVFGELKFDQIASLFGKSVSWARVTFYRAKMEMQKRIEE